MFADAAQLAAMRSEAGNTFLDECTVYRKTGDAMTKGIAKPVYDSGTATPCTFVGGSGTEIVAEGKATLIRPSMFILPATTVIGSADYISYGGATFDVRGDAVVSALDATLEIPVQRRK